MGNGTVAAVVQQKLFLPFGLPDDIACADSTPHPSPTGCRGWSAQASSQAAKRSCRAPWTSVLCPKKALPYRNTEIRLHLLPDFQSALITRSSFRLIGSRAACTRRICREVVVIVAGRRSGKAVPPLMLCPQAGCSTGLHAHFPLGFISCLDIDIDSDAGSARPTPQASPGVIPCDRLSARVHMWRTCPASCAANLLLPINDRRCS